MLSISRVFYFYPNVDLDINLDEDAVLVCSKTGQAVKYGSMYLEEESVL